MPSAPAIVRTKCTRVIARCAGTPGLPCAMVLRLIARSPWRRIPFASIADELTILRSPAGPENLHQLDTSHGCQNHTPLPSAASSTKTLRSAHVLPTEIPAKAFKRRSSARRLIAHRPKPALRSRSRPTLPRPSHPAPNVRDDRDTPLLWVGMAGVVGVIWGNREAEYFCRRHWTKPCVICPTGNATGSGALARTPPGSGRVRREAAGEGLSPCASMLQTA